MNLDQPTQANLKILLQQMGDRLGVANRILLDEKDYDLDRYDDLKFLHDHVMSTDKLSPSETHAFIDELRTVRKQ